MDLNLIDGIKCYIYVNLESNKINGFYSNLNKISGCDLDKIRRFLSLYDYLKCNRYLKIFYDKGKYICIIYYDKEEEKIIINKNLLNLFFIINDYSSNQIWNKENKYLIRRKRR